MDNSQGRFVVMRRGSGNAGGRGAAGDANIATVLDIVNKCSHSMKNLGSTIMEADEDHEPAFILKCKTDLLELAMQIEVLNSHCAITRNQIGSLQERPLESAEIATNSNSSSSSSSSSLPSNNIEDGPAVARRLKMDIEPKVKDAENSNNRQYSGLRRELVEMFEMESGNDSDEEIQAVQRGPTEIDFRCPVTLCQMTVALKK